MDSHIAAHLIGPLAALATRSFLGALIVFAGKLAGFSL
jgi:hypothetical protein